MPVCEEHKDRVLDCYRSKPSRVLECSSEVKEYMECVERAKKVLGCCTVYTEMFAVIDFFLNSFSINKNIPHSKSLSTVQ